MIELIIDDVKQQYKDNPVRLKHIEGVVDVAKKLAAYYGASIDDVEIAAWFHDYTKYDSIEEQSKYLSKQEIEMYKNDTYMYHALSAANLLKKRYNASDEVCQAVRYHIYGKEGMTLIEKIVLIADKIEPSRDFSVVQTLRRQAFINLEQSIITYLKDLVIYRITQGLPPQKELKNIIRDLEEYRQ